MNGVFTYNTEYTIRIVDELARAAEERGFESVWAPEHTHIPKHRKSPWPGGPDLPKEYWQIPADRSLPNNSLRTTRRDPHQRLDPLRCGDQFGARSGEDDPAAIEDDRLLSEVEREAGVLLDQQQRQLVFAPDPGEPGQHRIDNERRQALERLIHQQQ